MTMETAVSSLNSSSAALSPTKPAKDQALDRALEDFEAMFASAILKTSREGSGGGWLGGESSAGSDGIMEFAEQNIAKAIASKGAFGIAKAIHQSMKARET